MSHVHVMEIDQRKVYDMAHAISLCISMGYADGAYIYTRMLVRYMRYLSSIGALCECDD